MTMATMSEGPPAGGAAVESALAQLQPIRDLTRNFDIDIASCLQDFLVDVLAEQPGEITHSQVERIANAHNINFTQAALVLHNSSHIWGRKVEHLHALVFQELERLAVASSAVNGNDDSNGNVATTRGGRRARLAASADVLEFEQFDPRQEFLLLDDVLPTDTNADCREINQPRSRRPTPTVARRSGQSLNASSGGRTSEALARDRSGSLHASRSMMSGSRRQSTAASPSASAAAWAHLLGHCLAGGAPGNGGLRLMPGECDIADDGAYLLPGSGRPSLHDSDDETNRADASAANDPFASPSEQRDDDDDVVMGGMGDYDDDGDDDGAGFVFADDDDNDATNDAINPRDERRVTFAPSVDDRLAPPYVVEEPAEPDPWERLDPHALHSVPPKPMRLGNTLRLPPGLDKLPSECVTGARTRPGAQQTRRQIVAEPQENAPTCHGLSVDTFRRLMREYRGEEEGPCLPVWPVAEAPFFGDEFAYIARITKQRREAEKRRQKQQQHAQDTGVGKSNAGVEQAAAGADPVDDIGTYGGYDDCDDDDDFGGPAFGDDDEGDNNAASSFATNTGLTSLDQVYKDRKADGGEGHENADQSFAALCRARIAEFARGAEKYASDTHLSKRVDLWQGKIRPKLQEEDQRPSFDIHAYSERILTRLQDAIDGDNRNELENDTGIDIAAKPEKGVDFNRVVGPKSEPYEVCRMFLASLSLCNAGNVLLHQGGDCDVGNLRMEFLSGDFEHPMENYLAPTVADNV